MSAIRVTCPDCGETYLAGMVGRTPWPAHVCEATQPPSEVPHHLGVNSDGVCWCGEVHDDGGQAMRACFEQADELARMLKRVMPLDDVVAMLLNSYWRARQATSRYEKDAV